MISAGSVRATAASVNQESGLYEIFFQNSVFLSHSGISDRLAANLGLLLTIYLRFPSSLTPLLTTADNHNGRANQWAPLGAPDRRQSKSNVQPNRICRDSLLAFR